MAELGSKPDSAAPDWAQNHYGTLSLIFPDSREKGVLWELLLSPKHMWLWEGWICRYPTFSPNDGHMWSKITRQSPPLRFILLKLGRNCPHPMNWELQGSDPKVAGPLCPRTWRHKAVQRAGASHGQRPKWNGHIERDEVGCESPWI